MNGKLPEWLVTLTELLNKGALAVMAGMGVWLVWLLANHYDHKLDRIIQLLEILVSK